MNLQNNLLANIATMADVNQLLAFQLAQLPFYDRQKESDSYYANLRTINKFTRLLTVVGFNDQARTNKIIGKMIGRFHPISATNPYNRGNNIATVAEFLNWLQGKYREITVRTNQDALRALMTEKFTTIDMADTYEKRIKPYVQEILYTEVVEYLYGHTVTTKRNAV